jgi:hypothetical protein
MSAKFESSTTRFWWHNRIILNDWKTLIVRIHHRFCIIKSLILWHSAFWNIQKRNWKTNSLSISITLEIDKHHRNLKMRDHLPLATNPINKSWIRLLFFFFLWVSKVLSVHPDSFSQDPKVTSSTMRFMTGDHGKDYP